MTDKERAVKKARASEVDEDDLPDPWKSNCSDVIRLVVLEAATEEGLKQEIEEGGLELDAEFFHQHFEDEVIKGYKGLSIKLWFSARTYHVWIDMQYTQKKLGADKVVKVFSDHFPGGYSLSQADFIAAVTTALPKLVDLTTTTGTTVDTRTVPGRPPIALQLIQLATAPKEVQDLHARFEPLLLFFIDGAQLIEKGDAKWEALMVLQQEQGQAPVLMGLATFYNFWSYPSNTRVRLSQILVLDPYRDLGLGKALVRATYQIARDRRYVDLTIEDPTPNLQKLREKLEVEQLQACDWVKAQLDACVAAVTSGGSEWPAVPLPEPPPPPPPAPAPIHGMSDGGSTILNTQPAAGDEEAGARANSSRAAEQSSGVHGEASSPANNNSTGAAGAAGGRKAGSKGSGGAAGGAGSSSGGGDLAAALCCIQPSSQLVAAITREFKIYAKEVRLVWEMLLFLQPAVWSSPRGRQAVTAMVRSRLETSAFAHCTAEAERKDVFDFKHQTDTDKELGLKRNFIMMHCVNNGSSGEQAIGSSGGEVAQGRFGQATISVEEKESQLSEMCDERWEQLKTLKSLLTRATAQKAVRTA